MHWCTSLINTYMHYWAPRHPWVGFVVSKIIVMCWIPIIIISIFRTLCMLGVLSKLSPQNFSTRVYAPAVVSSYPCKNAEVSKWKLINITHPTNKLRYFWHGIDIYRRIWVIWWLITLTGMPSKVVHATFSEAIIMAMLLASIHIY